MVTNSYHLAKMFFVFLNKTVDNALKEGIDIYKDKNIHIQKLIDNHGNMEDVINYLHNSYYKTPFKNINKLFSGIHSTNN